MDAPQEDHPFEAVARLDNDMDAGLAVNAEVPMEFEGETLTASELPSVGGRKGVCKKVRTLAAGADAVFENAFGIKCTDAERKSASRIMDIVTVLISICCYIPAHSTTAC